ncbi:MAG: 6-bladed beta-propeller [Bacteroidales bacterium]|nr:6-bladed beta-propeller [Bacteroidales bacterium]
MKNQIVLFICCVAIMASCQTKTQNNPDHFVEVNGKNIPLIRMDLVEDSATTIGWSALFEDIEIIPLETSEDCMIMNWRTGFTQKSFILSTQVGMGSPCSVFEFDLQGNFIKEIGRGGKGPGEHVGYFLESFNFYPEQEILQFSFSGMGDEDFYHSIDGKFIEKIARPIELTSKMVRLNSDLSLVEGAITGRPTYARDSIFLLIYDNNLNIVKKYDRVNYPPKDVSGFSPGGWGGSLYRYGKSWKYFAPGNDTIFEVSPEKLIPSAIFSFDNNLSDYNKIVDPKSELGKYHIEIKRETDQYLFIEKKIVKKIDVREWRPGQWGGQYSMDYFLILYNKLNGESHNIRFQDDILGILPPERLKDFGTSLKWDPLGHVYFILQALDLVEWIDEALEKGSVPESGLDKVKTLRQAIDEDSNPVLFMFKERDKYGFIY